MTAGAYSGCADRIPRSRMSTQSKITAVIVVSLAAALALGIQGLKERRR